MEFDKALEDLLQCGTDVEIVSRAETSAAIVEWAKLANALRYPLASIDKLHNDAWQSAMKTLRQSVREVSEMRPGWLGVASPAAMDLDVPEIHSAAVAADQSSFIGRKKRRKAVLAQLTGVMTAEPKSIALKSLSSTTAEMAETHAASSTCDPV